MEGRALFGQLGQRFRAVAPTEGTSVGLHGQNHERVIDLEPPGQRERPPVQDRLRARARAESSVRVATRKKEDTRN